MTALFLAVGLEMAAPPHGEERIGPILSLRFRIYTADYDYDWALSRRRSVSDIDHANARGDDPNACSHTRPQY